MFIVPKHLNKQYITIGKFVESKEATVNQLSIVLKNKILTRYAVGTKIKILDSRTTAIKGGIIKSVTSNFIVIQLKNYCTCVSWTEILNQDIKLLHIRGAK